MQKLYPDVLMKSVHHINFEQLYADGYRGLIFDIDNTLVHHGAPADEKTIQFFAYLKEIGFSCCLMSNNKEPRVKAFNQQVQVQYIYDAHKPSSRSYYLAMEKMNTDLNTTAFIGDQIFTDIFGANRIGLRTIMVKRIYWKEEIQIFFKRWIEVFVLLAYKQYIRKEGLQRNDSPQALEERYSK